MTDLQLSVPIRLSVLNTGARCMRKKDYFQQEHRGRTAAWSIRGMAAMVRPNL